MSLKTEIQILENEFSILQKQASETSEIWTDTVQKRYYDQFINNLPKEFEIYNIELRNLDLTIETAEQAIENLLSDKE